MRSRQGIFLIAGCVFLIAALWPVWAAVAGLRAADPGYLPLVVRMATATVEGEGTASPTFTSTFTPTVTSTPTVTFTPTATPTEPYIVLDKVCTDGPDVTVVVRGYNWGAAAEIDLFWDGTLVQTVADGHGGMFEETLMVTEVGDGAHTVRATAGAGPTLIEATTAVQIPCPTPTPTTTFTPTPTPTATATLSPDWLIYLNEFRDLAGLPPVTENAAWSAGGVLHSRYMVKNGVITHDENPGNMWYTAEGAAAGKNGNVAVSSSSTAPDNFAINLWMTGPFHAISIIDPKLTVVGFGSYREIAPGPWDMGATLDVSRGRGALPPGQTFPVYFPKNGGQMPLTAHSFSEWPDPTPGCGYTRPTGPPIMLQLGTGSITPNVTAHSFKQGNTTLASCVFDETNYSFPGDSFGQSTGRLILNNRDAIVILPQSPLENGKSYTASITANGTTYTWSFTVMTPAADYRMMGTAEMR